MMKNVILCILTFYIAPLSHAADEQTVVVDDISDYFQYGMNEQPRPKNNIKKREIENKTVEISQESPFKDLEKEYFEAGVVKDEIKTMHSGIKKKAREK